MCQIHSRRKASPLLAYLLFVVLFLAAAVALIALYAAFSGEGRGAFTDADKPSTLNPLSSFLFVVDAGHGGEDGGASGSANGQTVLEKDINLDIALTLADTLRGAGAQVILTRQTDTLLYDRNCDYEGRKKALDMAARLAVVEQASATGKQVVFVSIHQNTFTSPRYSGLQVYYSTTSPKSKMLADTIQSTAKEQLAPENHRKTKQGEDIYLLKHLTCPAVLVECGFLSHPGECAALADEAYRNRVAYAIFSALRNFANAESCPPSSDLAS